MLFDSLFNILVITLLQCDVFILATFNCLIYIIVVKYFRFVQKKSFTPGTKFFNKMKSIGVK